MICARQLTIKLSYGSACRSPAGDCRPFIHSVCKQSPSRFGKATALSEDLHHQKAFFEGSTSVSTLLIGKTQRKGIVLRAGGGGGLAKKKGAPAKGEPGEVSAMHACLILLLMIIE